MAGFNAKLATFNIYLVYNILINSFCLAEAEKLLKEDVIIWPTGRGSFGGVYYGLYFLRKYCDGGLAGGEKRILRHDGGGERGGAGDRGGGAASSGMRAAAG